MCAKIAIIEKMNFAFSEFEISVHDRFFDEKNLCHAFETILMFF
jgi:hypothetical protein